MATETSEGLDPHLRGVTVTTICTLAGIAAGVASAQFAVDPSDVIGLYILVTAILAQLPIMKVLGVRIREFGTKDKLYVGFMTTVLWYITWSVLLTVESL